MDPNTPPQPPQTQLTPPPSTVAPAPMSPDSPAGIPAGMTSADPATMGGMTQEQMKANLQELMSKIEAKMQDFNSQKFATDNKLKEQQSQALREVFDLFKSNDVDPSNLDEVSAFLQKVKDSNPELAQQLEKALETILGEDPLIPEVMENQDTDTTETASPDAGGASDNMNINTNDQGISQDA